MKSRNLKSAVAPFILAITGSVLYISLIFNNNLWLDEAFSASLIRTNFREILNRSMNDTLPPLYNLLNKCMTLLLGYNAPAMKFNSVLPMLLLFVLSITVIRKHFGNIASCLFTLCISGMPYLFYFGVEIRMYSWGLFFTTASGIFAFLVVRQHSLKNWILFTLFSVCAGYTHHFAFVSVGFVYLVLLLYFIIQDRPRIRSWIICLFFTGLLYFPCLLITLKQFKKVNGYFSMPEVTLRSFLRYFIYPFTTGLTPLSIVLILVFAALLLFHIIKYRKSEISILCASTLFIWIGTICFGSLASLLLSSNIFTERYMVPSLGLLWLGFSLAGSQLGKKLLIPLFLMIILVDATTYISQYRQEYASGVTEMTSFFDQNISAMDGYLISEDDYQIEICFRYYYPDLKKYDVDHIKEIKGTIWYFLVDGFEEDFDKVKAQGYSSEYIGNFTFDRYHFKLYKLKN